MYQLLLCAAHGPGQTVRWCWYTADRNIDKVLVCGFDMSRRWRVRVKSTCEDGQSELKAQLEKELIRFKFCFKLFASKTT